MSGFCKDCVSGVLHGGTPTGRVENMYGLPAYVAEPEAGSTASGIVVLVTDAFGWEFNNLRVLCDNYAKKGGFKVMMPDLMDGHWLAHNVMDSMDNAVDAEQTMLTRIGAGLHAVSNFIPFLFFNRQSVTGPRVYKWFAELRAAEPQTKIGAAGFCWGGKWTFLLCAPATANPTTEAWFKQTGVGKLDASKPLLDAGFTAHPSMLVLPDDAQRLVSPVSVANGTLDFQVTEAKAPLVENAFAKLNAEAGTQKHTYVRFKDASHGFAVRWNPKDERQNKQGAESEAQAIAHFQHWLS